MTAQQFEVRGYIPSPQGSKKHVGNGIMVEVSPTVKLWRSAVADAAVLARIKKITGPVIAHMEFVFPRPASHFGTGKNSTKLKPQSPKRGHSVRPDLSKLVRSTEDALSGIAYEDDARIVRFSHLEKRYANGDELPGAIIKLWAANNYG
tara:strand:+ start:318 stop:764 length:447 start_codon:yes stop_codon:yes gene_type:complete